MSPLLISRMDLLCGFFFFLLLLFPPTWVMLFKKKKKKRHECAHQNLIVYTVYTSFCSVWHQLTDGTAITQNQSEKYDF